MSKKEPTEISPSEELEERPGEAEGEISDINKEGDGTPTEDNHPSEIAESMPVDQPPDSDPPEKEEPADSPESEKVDSEDLLASARLFFSDDRPQRFVIGFLFGMAFFFVTAGLAEVLLARNEACIQALADFRLAPDPNEVCMSEFEFFLARGMSRGMIGILSPETSVFIAWPAMAILFGLLGGGLAQLPLRVAIVGFVIVYVLLLMAFMSVDFMSQFIVFQ